jgi:TolB-like protein/serine/threonine protein kinase/tetratricopeptide (TPR) repeat protein
MNLHGLSDSVAGVTESPAKCRQCGATTKFGNGFCLSCTLRQGLDADREASRESFEAILVEDHVQDTHWRVGNYEILEEIGRGGMGVIYRARQRHSRRIVALKRMVSYHADSRETRERFRREAEAASSLDHPNILPIYEVGQGEDGLPFFSMKYAAGGSLQKTGPALRREPRGSVRLIAKVARAVQYAHEHGVLHRDLKPGNILLDGRGEPLVTDFGLAKWLDTSTDLTRTLTIFGTPGYIAPEQAKGPASELTPAADVYSLGAVLFDMFTGRPPFLGEHALAVIQQASEKPAPKLRSIAPALDRDLETICARCLEREPQARYRSAGDLAVDLERWLDGRPIIARRVPPPVRAWRWSRRNPKLAAATAAAFCSAMAAAFLFFSHNGLPPQSSLESRPRATSAPVKTMAVLPFKMLTTDSHDEYLAIGLADALITQIGGLPQILVRPISAVQKYAESHTQDPLAAGRELRVESVLDGSLQREADNLHVMVRLSRVRDGTVLWSSKFDKKFTDVFAIQDSISQEVAKALIRNLSGEDHKLLTKRHTDNTEAFRAYLKGCYFWNKRTPAGLQQSLEYFRQAIDLDPTYSSAYAGMADAYALLVWQDELPRTDLSRAKAAASKALEIDDTLAEPHATLGFVNFWYDWDSAIAESEFRRAIELNPDYAMAHHWYGESLGVTGRFEEGLKELRVAQQIDPLSLVTNADLGKLLFFARQPDEAIDQLQKTIELNPGFPLAHLFLALAYNQKGLHEQAIRELKGLADRPDSRAIFKATLGFVYANSGQTGEALNILNELMERRSSKQFISPFQIALVYTGLGKTDQALEWLEKAKLERDPFLLYVQVDPNFDRLRNHPRFIDLIKQVGVAPVQSLSEAIRSVAVLPLKNLTDNPENEYLTDGLTESLISSLSKTEGLKVISRGSVFAFKGKEIDPREVGRQLGVMTIVEGSLLKSDGAARVSMKLLSTMDGRVLWSGDSFGHSLNNIFALENELVRSVAAAIRPNLGSEEESRMTKRYTESAEAYQLCLKGRYFWNERTAEDIKKAIHYFNYALEKDPNYALAYAGLADSYALINYYDGSAPSESFPKAREAAEKALKIDDTLAEAHASLGYIKRAYDWDWAGASREFKRAIELNPNYATAHFWYGEHLTYLGRFDEGIAEIRSAEELDPLSPIISGSVGWALHMARQPDPAIEQLRKTLPMDPDFAMTHFYLGMAYEGKQMYPEAIAEYRKSEEISPEGPGIVGLGHAYAISGKRDDARKVLDELIHRAERNQARPTTVAIVYAGLNDNDHAFEWMEKAYDQRAEGVVYLKAQPYFDNLLSDPRRAAFLRRIGLD